jgi:hypothetical protein
MTVTSGGDFNAGIVPPGPIETPVLPARRELTDEFLTMMCSLDHALLTPEEITEIRVFVVPRMEANKRALALIDRVHQRARLKVIAEHEHCKRDVLEAQRQVQQHHDKILELQQELNRRREREAQVVAVFHDAQARKRQMSRFSSARDIAAINKELAAAESKVAAASEQCGLLQAQINNMTLTGLQPLVTKLNSLIAEESQLGHHVDGRSFTTPEGLVVPARQV